MLYASGFFWTLGYDTIYALQDRDDDALIGIKSSARWLTERYKGNIQIPLYGFYAAHYLLLLMAIISIQSSVLSVFFILPFLHLLWQVKTLSIAEPQNSLKRFKSNRDYGLMVCVVIILGNLI